MQLVKSNKRVTPKRRSNTLTQKGVKILDKHLLFNHKIYSETTN